jgi:hypothetical protein
VLLPILQVLGINVFWQRNSKRPNLLITALFNMERSFKDLFPVDVLRNEIETASVGGSFVSAAGDYKFGFGPSTKLYLYGGAWADCVDLAVDMTDDGVSWGVRSLLSFEADAQCWAVLWNCLRHVESLSCGE